MRRQSKLIQALCYVIKHGEDETAADCKTVTACKPNVRQVHVAWRLKAW